jgi:transcriptional regulator with XRE-family HTH domain
MGAGSSLRASVGKTVREGRRAIGWSKATLAQRAGLSATMVRRVESATVNVTLDTAGRLLDALGVTAELSIGRPFVARSRQVDAGHARCVAYVQRRLERAGWLVRREVEVVHGRSHGWIDILAFNPETGVLLVVEVKTEIHDVGRVERTLAWYGRSAWAAARRVGWRPSAVRTALLVLATEANEERIRSNREVLAQSFPTRGMANLASGPPERPGPSGLALIDPRSHRRDWLLRCRVDGRRSTAPYRDYAAFVSVRVGRDPSRGTDSTDVSHR